MLAERVRSALRNGDIAEARNLLLSSREDPALWAEDLCHYQIELEKQNRRLLDAKEESKQAPVEAKSAPASSEARLRAILGSAPIGIAVMDAARRFIEVNPALCALTGYSADQLIGQSSRKLYPDEASFARVGRDKLARFAQGATYEIELRMLRSDGHPLNVAMSAAPLEENDAGQLSTVIIQDLTSSREIESELRLRVAALDAAANAIIVTEADGSIQWANAAFFRDERLCGARNLRPAPRRTAAQRPAGPWRI